MEAIHVIVADASPLTRLGITSLLHQTNYPLLFREVTHAEKLTLSMHKDQKNLLIISQSFINQSPPSLISQIQQKKRNTFCVIIQDAEAQQKSIPKGDETITFEDSEKMLLRKFERLLRLLSGPTRTVNQPDEISEREKEVLQLVALGMTNREIADKLFISSHTVITHRKNITAKLGIRTIAGLTVYAIIHKLIAPESLH